MLKEFEKEFEKREGPKKMIPVVTTLKERTSKS